LAGWLAFVLALLAFPLTAFLRPLARLKQETLAQAGAQAIGSTALRSARRWA
jgi:hypothetical protein